jgi:hypothetical protein
MLTAVLVTQLGCTQANVETGGLAFCDRAIGLPEPHLVINPANRTIKTFDVTYHMEDCSNDEFICLDGPISFLPFIQPRPSTRAGNSRIELRGNAEVRITALGNGGSRIEISKTEASRSLKVIYNYGVDSVLQSLEITASFDGTTETARYEPCR